jgi:hypothetical protein
MLSYGSYTGGMNSSNGSFTKKKINNFNSTVTNIVKKEL